jgi:hypothetical protein
LSRVLPVNPQAIGLAGLFSGSDGTFINFLVLRHGCRTSSGPIWDSTPSEESPQALAQRWRQRAEELRGIAALMEHPIAARDIADLAQRWDVMARHAEERAAKEPPRP